MRRLAFSGLSCHLFAAVPYLVLAPMLASQASNASGVEPTGWSAPEANHAYQLALVVLSVCVVLLLAADLGRSTIVMRQMRPSALEALFLPAYALCASADWLQGPYVFALYMSYGFERATVNMLFLTGFLSAGLLAPFAGGLADRYGRRASCVFGYCGLYALACVTKHFRSIYLLLLGRVLGGAATSVLFSSFESWLVAQHGILGLPSADLGGALSRMYFINGVCGILMGLLAEAGADAAELTPAGGAGSILYVGGDVTPFDMSFGFLVLGGILIRCTWAENHAPGAKPPVSDASAESTKAGKPVVSLESSGAAAIAGACSAMGRDPLLWVLMAASATMESAMYAFVLEWTPTVGSTAGAPPLGLIFAAFMVSYMAVSTSVSIVTRDAKSGRTASTLLVVLASTALTALIFIYVLLVSSPAGDDKPPEVAFAAFCAMCIFEFALGAYMPTMASLKATFVPEDVRATVYSIFRVPLNAIVVVVLLVSLTSATTFLFCSCLLAVCLSAAIAAMCMVMRRDEHLPLGTSKGPAENTPLVKSS